MASQPSTTYANSASTAKPPVTFPASTHLDAGAYVRGSHAITLGEHNLIHPRAHLIAVHGPVIIDSRCIVSEKCTVGGPVSSSGSAGGGVAADGQGSSTTASAPIPGAEQGDNENDEDDEADPVKTMIGQSVYLHAGSHVHAGASIHDAVVLEPNVTVLAGVTVGAHAKICAGLTVVHDIEPWTVVMGEGNVRRLRRRPQRSHRPLASGTNGEDDHDVPDPKSGRDGEDGEELVDLIEARRLKAMDKEREGTVLLFRAALRLQGQARKKAAA